MTSEFNTDPNAEAQILKQAAQSGDHLGFQDQARQLLNNPEEFKQVQALMQAGKPYSLPGLELISAQPGDGGQNKGTPDLIRFAEPTNLQVITPTKTSDVCVAPPKK